MSDNATYQALGIAAKSLTIDHLTATQATLWNRLRIYSSLSMKEAANQSRVQKF
jgi:hypothetical protein